MATSHRTSSGEAGDSGRFTASVNFAVGFPKDSILFSWRIAFFPERSDSTRPVPFQQAAFSASRLDPLSSKTANHLAQIFPDLDLFRRVGRHLKIFCRNLKTVLANADFIIESYVESEGTVARRRRLAILGAKIIRDVEEIVRFTSGGCISLHAAGVFYPPSDEGSLTSPLLKST